MPQTDTYIEKDASHQRRDRPAAARGHQRAVRAAGRDHRGQRVVHLRPGLARGLRRHDAVAASTATSGTGTTCCGAWWASSTSATTWFQAGHLPGAGRRGGDRARRTRKTSIRIEFFGDEVERIVEVDPLTGEILGEREHVAHLPGDALCHAARRRCSGPSRRIEAELEERLQYFRDKASCWRPSGWSSGRGTTWRCCRKWATARASRTTRGIWTAGRAGEPPATLLDYFPEDFLMIIDESHQTIPQVRAMYDGDRSRKETLVEHGFRLPSALDNRPLTFEEFEERHATRSCLRRPRRARTSGSTSQRIVEQIIRPTGLVDPEVEVQPAEGQMDDLMEEMPAGHRPGRAGAGDDADQEDGGGLDGLPGRHGHAGAVSALGHRRRWSGWRFCGTCGWASSTCWWASTCCGKGWTCRKCRWSRFWTRTRKASCGRRRR